MRVIEPSLMDQVKREMEDLEQLAAQLDKLDVLSHLRNEFHIPKGP